MARFSTWSNNSFLLFFRGLGYIRFNSFETADRKKCTALLHKKYIDFKPQVRAWVG